jgi:hypothetical protein
MARKKKAWGKEYALAVKKIKSSRLDGFWWWMLENIITDSIIEDYANEALELYTGDQWEDMRSGAARHNEGWD